MWNKILQDLKDNPRDIQTAPLRGSGIWFYAESDGKKVIISKSKSHTPSVNITGNRTLNSAQYEKMLIIYMRRKKGEQVSGEAAQSTFNKVYWYGLFNAFGL